MTPEQEQELQGQVAQLRQQQSFQTAAIKALVEGKVTGEASAVAFLLALNPTLEIHPSPLLDRPT